MGGGILPLVNSSIAQLLQTKTQQPYVKVNVPRSTATAAVSQLGLPASYVSNKGIQPICTFQGLVPGGKVSLFKLINYRQNCTTIQTK